MAAADGQEENAKKYLYKQDKEEEINCTKKILGHIFTWSYLICGFRPTNQSNSKELYESIVLKIYG